ncbi:hypothetical protein ACFPM0_36450 [Pseudonocardia sulfidoxydans]
MAGPWPDRPPAAPQTPRPSTHNRLPGGQARAFRTIHPRTRNSP